MFTWAIGMTAIWAETTNCRVCSMLCFSCSCCWRGGGGDHFPYWSAISHLWIWNFLVLFGAIGKTVVWASTSCKKRKKRKNWEGRENGGSCSIPRSFRDRKFLFPRFGNRWMGPPSRFSLTLCLIPRLSSVGPALPAKLNQLTFFLFPPFCSLRKQKRPEEKKEWANSPVHGEMVVQDSECDKLAEQEQRYRCEKQTERSNLQTLLNSF